MSVTIQGTVNISNVGGTDFLSFWKKTNMVANSSNDITVTGVGASTRVVTMNLHPMTLQVSGRKTLSSIARGQSKTKVDNDPVVKITDRKKVVYNITATCELDNDDKYSAWDKYRILTELENRGEKLNYLNIESELIFQNSNNADDCTLTDVTLVRNYLTDSDTTNTTVEGVRRLRVQLIFAVGQFR